MSKQQKKLKKSHSQENPQKISTMQQEHLKTMKQNSNVYSIKWKKNNPRITKTMRITLIDWLMELTAQLSLPKTVIYNAIFYIDKFVSSNSVQRSQYQMIGLCSLFIASKLQLSSHPRVSSYLQAMDKTCSKKSLLELQIKIVKSLKYKLNPPTLYDTMLLILYQLKAFKSIYKLIDLPDIISEIYLKQQIFWIIDGLILDQETKHFSYEKLCLSVIYIIIKKYRKDTIKTKLISELENINIGKLQIGFQSFMNFVNRDNQVIGSIKDCIRFLSKWAKYQCKCQINSIYHPQLKQIITKNF